MSMKYEYEALRKIISTYEKYLFPHLALDGDTKFNAVLREISEW